MLAAHAYALLVSLPARGGHAALRGGDRGRPGGRGPGRGGQGAARPGGLPGDLGELDRAIALALEARRIAEEVGDAETVIDTYVAR